MNRKISLVLFISILLVSLVGCSSIEDSMSQEEAVEKFMDNYDSTEGEPEIISIEKDKNTYIIEWENRDNLESGRYRINKNGKVEEIERRIE